MEGHVLVISKALYGLKTSGKQFHELSTDTFHIEAYIPCKANSDVWMGCNGDTYEYIAVFVNDLICTMKDPRRFLFHLIKVHNYT